MSGAGMDLALLVPAIVGNSEARCRPRTAPVSPGRNPTPESGRGSIRLHAPLPGNYLCPTAYRIRLGAVVASTNLETALSQ